MTIEDALNIVDSILGNKSLSTIQEAIFRQTWEGKTYAEIAEMAGYDAAYIRDVGYKLWQLLSEAFGDRVTKNNLQVILRRYSNRSLQNSLQNPMQNSMQISNAMGFANSFANSASGNAANALPNNFASNLPSNLPTISPAINYTNSAIANNAVMPIASDSFGQEISNGASKLLQLLSRVLMEPIGDRYLQQVHDSNHDSSLKLTITVNLSMAE